MGSSLSAIESDQDYYNEICNLLNIKCTYSNMYSHMQALETQFGVKGKYNLIAQARIRARNSNIDNIIADLDKLEKKYE